MKLKVLACDVLARELYYCAAFSQHIIDIELLDSSYHEKPESMHIMLQERINEIKDGYDYILIGFGLCGKVLNKLKSRDIPLVIPRAHDCMTLFMGSKKKYEEYFINNPGTMFYAESWTERKGILNERKEFESVGLTKTFEEYEKKYGREIAEYLYKILGDWKNKYTKALHLYNKNMGKKYSKDLKEIAKKRNWIYLEMEIDNSLITNFINGNWNDEEFVIIEKNKTILQSIDQNLIEYK